ncbi:asparaginase [Marinivivus vitaminiproducens]|uniref:asparaginase n=1 Tax=Marinivivus vitaminiproducens TaxID=3035935 RepID=UPI0027A8A96F|nr:asparaginase [Geminicoccaceae bacterium SCSIO 64248]
MNRPRISVLATGGTIASAGASPTATTVYAIASGVEQLLAAVPAAADLATLSGEQIANVPSHELTSHDGLRLARRIRALQRSGQCDGVVVTHGTDTIEETAFLLDRVLPDGFPVVLTGAMRPASAVSADGPLNLINAIRIAALPQAAGRGVLVTLNERIGAARHVAKRHTTAVDAFDGGEAGWAGAIRGERVTFFAPPAVPAGPRFDLGTIEALADVVVLHGHQDMPAWMFDAAIERGVRGIVFAATGNGSMPGPVRAAAARCRARGVLVVRASRTGGGAVTPRPDDAEQGLIPAGGLNPQKARILLALALTRTDEPDAVRDLFAAVDAQPS